MLSRKLNYLIKRLIYGACAPQFRHKFIFIKNYKLYLLVHNKWHRIIYKIRKPVIKSWLINFLPCFISAWQEIIYYGNTIFFVGYILYTKKAENNTIECKGIEIISIITISPHLGISFKEQWLGPDIDTSRKHKSSPSLYNVCVMHLVNYYISNYNHYYSFILFALFSVSVCVYL